MMVTPPHCWAACSIPQTSRHHSSLSPPSPSLQGMVDGEDEEDDLDQVMARLAAANPPPEVLKAAAKEVGARWRRREGGR